MELKIRFLDLFIFLMILTISYESSTQNEEKRPFTTVSVEDWAKKNNIFIHPNLVLNKNKKVKNFYYFLSNDTIPNNTLLFRMPYDMIISQNNFNSYYNSINAKNKKFQNFWNEVLIENNYLRFFPSKQLFYMAVIMLHSINKQKGFLYKKYEEYFNMYNNMDLYTFPIFYTGEEKGFLSDSNFGKLLIRVDKFFNDEFYLLTKIFKIKAENSEDFFKYRFLALSNSINFPNENLNYSNGFNETVIIPLIDCFNKVMSKEKSNAYYVVNSVNNDTNSSHKDYFFEIYSTKEIKNNSEINLKWLEYSNTDSLIYFGFAEEGNMVKPQMTVEVFNKKLKETLNVDDKKIYQMLKKTYELNLEYKSESVINAYKTLIVKIPKYSGKPEGAYEMQYDNLKYYLDLYETQLTDGNINKYINNKENVKNIREIIHLEKKMIEDKMEYLRGVINNIKNGKNKDGDKSDL